MTRSRWTSIASALAAAGGAAWLAKIGVIAGTDGEVTDTGAAAAFFLSGVALMVVGSSWIGTRLAAGRPAGVVVLLALLSPVAFFVSFAVLESVAKAVVGDAGPAWLKDEVGIAATGAFWLLAGIWSLRGARHSASEALASRAA